MCLVTKMFITGENATDDKKIDKELSKILRFMLIRRTGETTSEEINQRLSSFCGMT